jgi:hypothetical protein
MLLKEMSIGGRKAHIDISVPQPYFTIQPDFQPQRTQIVLISVNPIPKPSLCAPFQAAEAPCRSPCEGNAEPGSATFSASSSDEPGRQAPLK